MHKLNTQFELVGEFVSIFDRNGNWHVNYQHGRRQIRRSLGTRSKKEARRRALRIEKEILDGSHRGMSRPKSISEVIEEYCRWLESEGRSKKTMKKYRFCFALLENVCAGASADRIDQLNLSIVDKFRSMRFAGSDGVRAAQPKTVHNDTVSIRQLVNFALRRKYLSSDPLSELKIKKPPRTPQPCWTPDEVEKIIATANDQYRSVFRFLADTGTRIGEAVWLAWEDVNLEQGMIYIRAKVGWKPKTGNARAIPMTPRLKEWFRNHCQPTGWVFRGKLRLQLSDRRTLAHLKRVVRDLKLPGHLHTFRHAFISNCAIRGVPERVVREWVGQIDPEIIAWYFHLADAQSRAEMERIAALTPKGGEIT